MTRVVLNHKLVLVDGLTSQEASNLVKMIRERPELNDLYPSLWIENKGENYRVYVLDEDKAKAFVNQPNLFIFDVPGDRP